MGGGKINLKETDKTTATFCYTSFQINHVHYNIYINIYIYTHTHTHTRV
jgi:hypothetical protein